jgi:7-cyano-7-deazaguanine synthase in queuosine biosynthesis
MKSEVLRKKYPKFVYRDYSWKISKNNLEIFFSFEIEPSIHFRPKVVIKGVKAGVLDPVRNRKFLNGVDNLVFNLGLMEIPSYWKATCSPIIEIDCGYLNAEQIKWWKDVIINGLGQFFYENKINFKKPNFLKIRINHSEKPLCKNLAIARFLHVPKNGILVPVGGGKDSAVTLELLKKAKKNIRCFSLNPTDAAKKIMEIAGCRNPIIAERKIDAKLLELNRKGFLNGHTPFSAYLAFLSVLATVLSGFKNIAVSNEKSSNEGNVRYLGKIINHQWSKSSEFEKKFRKYSKKYLAKNVKYFSFLRPFYEIQIAELFSKYPKYFNTFLSCNEAYKTASGRKRPTRKWCGKCSKCLFVFIILYPFLKEKTLLKIFGKNLFEDKKLLPIMQELIAASPREASLAPSGRGERRFKPFECVGTKKETLTALYLGWKKHEGHSSIKLPFLLEYFEKKILLKYPKLEEESRKIL